LPLTPLSLGPSAFLDFVNARDCLLEPVGRIEIVGFVISIQSKIPPFLFLINQTDSLKHFGAPRHKLQSLVQSFFGFAKVLLEEIGFSDVVIDITVLGSVIPGLAEQVNRLAVLLGGKGGHSFFEVGLSEKLHCRIVSRLQCQRALKRLYRLILPVEAVEHDAEL